MNNVVAQTSSHCEVCDKERKFRCSSCQVAYYCSKSHQVQDWQRHRKICNISQKGKKATIPNCQLQGSTVDVSGLSSQVDPMFNSNTCAYSEKLLDFTAIDQTLCRSLQELSEKILEDLNTRNFCAIDNFLDNSLASQIYNEIRSLYDGTNLFHPGQLSQSSSKEKQRDESNKEIRGDFVTWIDFATYPNMTHLLSAVRYIDKIIALMASSPFLADCNIRSRSSVMVACYPGEGAHYKRHVDNPCKDGRKLTTILYLNKNYIAARDGGVLRIHQPNSSFCYDVEPVFGRLVLFWSDSRTPHEVLPSFRERFAVSVWYFDTKERIEALQSGNLPLAMNQ